MLGVAQKESITSVSKQAEIRGEINGTNLLEVPVNFEEKVTNWFWQSDKYWNAISAG